MTSGGIRALAALAAGLLVLAGASLAVLIDDQRPERDVAIGVIHSAPGEPPHLTDERLAHIKARHWPQSTASQAGKFAAPMSKEQLIEYIREADETGASRPNTGGRAGRLLEYDFGRNIGTSIDGRSTSRIRIVVSDNNQVITAFPF